MSSQSLPRDALYYTCSAKSGIAIACRLSVCLSVTLVDQDHISSKCWKLIVRTISPTSSLFVAQRPSTYSQGNLGKFFGRLEVWLGKVACWSTKAAISLKRVKIDEKLLWRAYRNSPTLFRTVPSQPPTGSPSPRLGVRYPNPKLQSLLSHYISGTGKATDCKFGRYIHTFPSEQKPVKNLGERERGRIQGLPKFFEYPLLYQE